MMLIYLIICDKKNSCIAVNYAMKTQLLPTQVPETIQQ